MICIEAKGSSIAGAPTCGAGEMLPLADPTDWTAAACSTAEPCTAMSAFDWTRQPGAVTRARPLMTMSSEAPEPELSTQSGIMPSEAAVALAWIDQPPGGRRLPKKESRWPDSVTVRLELSAAKVVSAVTPSFFTTCGIWLVMNWLARAAMPAWSAMPSCLAASSAVASAASCMAL